MYFLGYPPLSKGYICLEVSTRKLYISPHCIFHEFVFPSLSSLDSVSSSPSSSLPAFHPWLATLLPLILILLLTLLLLLFLTLLLLLFPMCLHLFLLLVSLPILIPCLPGLRVIFLSPKPMLFKLTMLLLNTLLMLWLPVFSLG